MIYLANSERLTKAKLRYLADRWGAPQTQVVALGIEMLHDLTKEGILTYEKKGKYVLSRTPTRTEIYEYLLSREEPKRMAKLKLSVKKNGITEKEQSLLEESAFIEEEVASPGETPLDVKALLATLEKEEAPAKIAKVSSKEQEEKPVPLSKGRAETAMEDHNREISKKLDEIIIRLRDIEDRLALGQVPAKPEKVQKVEKVEKTEKAPVVAAPVEPKEEKVESTPLPKSEVDSKKEAAIVAYLRKLQVKKRLNGLAEQIADSLKMDVDQVIQIIQANTTVTGTRAKWVYPLDDSK